MDRLGTYKSRGPADLEYKRRLRNNITMDKQKSRRGEMHCASRRMLPAVENVKGNQVKEDTEKEYTSKLVNKKDAGRQLMDKLKIWQEKKKLEKEMQKKEKRQPFKVIGHIDKNDQMLFAKEQASKQRAKLTERKVAEGKSSLTVHTKMKTASNSQKTATANNPKDSKVVTKAKKEVHSCMKSKVTNVCASAETSRSTRQGHVKSGHSVSFMLEEVSPPKLPRQSARISTPSVFPDRRHKHYRSSLQLRGLSPTRGVAVLRNSPLIEMNRRRSRVSMNNLGDSVHAVSSSPDVENGKITNSQQNEDTRDVQYYTDLVTSETKRLNALADQWDQLCVQEADKLPSDAEGEIRTTVGQARLLIAERFKQFSGLVDDCKLNRGVKQTTCSDLQGFWDMVNYQIEDVNEKFSKLEKMKECDWKTSQPESAIQVQPKRKKITTKESVKQRKPAGKSKFAEFRAKMKHQQKEATANPTIAVTTASDEGSSSKVFEGGFFLVESPVKDSASPSARRRKSSRSLTTQNKLNTPNNNASIDKPMATSSVCKSTLLTSTSPNPLLLVAAMNRSLRNSALSEDTNSVPSNPGYEVSKESVTLPATNTGDETGSCSKLTSTPHQQPTAQQTPRHLQDAKYSTPRKSLRRSLRLSLSTPGQSSATTSATPLQPASPDTKDLTTRNGDDNVAHVPMECSDAAQDNGIRDVHYYRSLVNNETIRLNKLADEWELLCGDDTISSDVEGEIRTTVGQARLLIAERFKQFIGLVDDCEYKRGVKETTCTDLQGFWDMVYYQIEDVCKKFEKLDILKQNDWVELEPEPAKKKRKATTKRPARSNKPVGKSKFAEFRDKMNHQQKEAAANNPTIAVTTAPDEGSTSKVFEGGFFSVESPVKDSASPPIRQRKSSRSLTTINKLSTPSKNETPAALTRGHQQDPIDNTPRRPVPVRRSLRLSLSTPGQSSATTSATLLQPASPATKALTACNDDNVAHVPMECSDAAQDNGIRDVHYFRSLVNNETVRLNKLADEWELLCGADTVPVDVEGEIRTTVGQARLLIAERFKQFVGLVDDCEYKRGVKQTTCTDLQGFWDMVQYQIDDVDQKFTKLDVLKQHDWITLQPEPLKKAPLKRKRVVKKQPVKATKPAAKSKFAEFREKMKQHGKNKDNEAVAITVTTAPDEGSSSKVFEGGFFSVKSPVKDSASPPVRRRKSSRSLTINKFNTPSNNAEVGPSFQNENDQPEFKTPLRKPIRRSLRLNSISSPVSPMSNHPVITESMKSRAVTATTDANPSTHTGRGLLLDISNSPTTMMAALTVSDKENIDVHPPKRRRVRDLLCTPRNLRRSSIFMPKNITEADDLIQL